MEMLGGLGVVGILLLVFIAILWVLLPFAVFGVKDLVSAAIAQQKITNTLLQQLIDKTKT